MLRLKFHQNRTIGSDSQSTSNLMDSHFSRKHRRKFDYHLDHLRSSKTSSLLLLFSLLLLQICIHCHQSLAFDINHHQSNHHHNHHHHNHHSQNNGPRPPRIKEHPSSAVVRKHEPITLSCKADGDPEPVIEWYRDNELVRKSSNHIYLNNGDLFILKVMNHKKEKDTGIYYCLARNVHGKARSHNATIEIASIRDEFRVLPKNVLVAVGDVAILECSPPRGYPEPRIQWRKDDELIVSMNGRYQLSGSNLHINDVRPEDAGRYQCIAQNLGGSRESPPAQLIVRVKPYFITKPEDVTALSNKMAEIHCKVGGDPLPKVTWRREGGQISSQRASITEDKSLRIYNVTDEDEGLYICEAENSVDKISHSATLIVHSKPTFLIEPKDVRVNINGVAKFECMASGNPRPSVFWNKEGNQFLMFPDNKYDRFSVTPDGSLIISPVKKDDKGYYVCSALSVVSSSTTKAYLNITSVADIPPPIIVLGPADQVLPEHTTGMLPCEATGSPQPSLKWFFNNNPIQLANARFNVLETGTLQIDDLQTSDSGEYKCLVYSENGETSWSAQLKVATPHSTNTMFHRMPDAATYPDPPSRPNIINTTENSVTISWIRTGRDGASPFKGVIIEYFSPDHHNEWIRAAKGIISDKFTITGLKSNSRYYFLVRTQNNHGIGPPSPISYEAKTLAPTSNINENNQNYHSSNRLFDLSDVRRKLENTIIELKDVRTISSSAVKLFWNVRGSQEYIEGFYIRYRIIDPKNFNHEMNNGDIKYNIVTVSNIGASTYIINNLPKFTTFEFFLVPFYKSVDGKPSNSRIARTLEGVPSAPPGFIKARPISSSSALITWQPPSFEQTNGVLLGFILFVHGTYTNYNLNLTVDANTTSYLLRNLTSESEYIIQITAFTSAGVGVPSSPLTFIMDSLMTNDVYNEQNYVGPLDSSNVWIWVLIISLIILSFVILLLGFLLFKKKTTLLKKNNDNLTINRDLKSQSDQFYNRHFEFTKGWSNDSHQQRNDPKQISTTNNLLKISPTFIPTDNNGYSTVTTDDQGADYADYDYVSQQGENNYESTYDQYGQSPVAYASSSIISNGDQYRLTAQKQSQPSLQWRTQYNHKKDNPLKSNFTTTLDRSSLLNANLPSKDNYAKKFLYDSSLAKNAVEPLIGASVVSQNLNDYEDTNSHYHYADSMAYAGCGASSNVTQIPSSKLMANQVKYGSLSRINNQTQQQQQQTQTKNANILQEIYKKKTFGPNDVWKPFIGNSNDFRDGLKSQFEMDTKTVSYGKNRHIIPNPLSMQSQPQSSQIINDRMQQQQQFNKILNNVQQSINDFPMIRSLQQNSNANGLNDSNNSDQNKINNVEICDNELTYQELS